MRGELIDLDGSGVLREKASLARKLAQDFKCSLRSRMAGCNGIAHHHTAGASFTRMRSPRRCSRIASSRPNGPSNVPQTFEGPFVDAARQILAQGGIPSIGVVSGGRLSAIRMEHAWVEAYVPYAPGRGATSTTAGASSLDLPKIWVPIDPSFKQHTFSQAMNLSQDVAFDAQGFLTAAQQGATVNEQQGWVDRKSVV